MIFFKRAVTVGFIVMLLMGAQVSGQEAHSRHGSLHLSPKLMKLLRAEMRSLLTGIQSLAKGIATADWKTVAETSAQINASYILSQKLTSAQKKEFRTSLPEHFKRLDSYFHLQAKKLQAAALNHNAQLAAFYYYRLIDTCASCHSIYAKSRFPNFAPAVKHSHAH